MCVIIMQPKGSYLSKDLAWEAWKANPDGGGFAFHNGDKLEVFKSMDFNTFWRKFERTRSDNRDQDFVVHFRIATHGTVNLDNCHPFVMPDGQSALAHNGIIHGVPDYKDGRSDTRVFVDEVLPYMADDWYENKWLREAVGDGIGWSKLAVVGPNGYAIINEKDGYWRENMWFSNLNGLPFSKVSKPAGWTVNSKGAVTKPPLDDDGLDEDDWAWINGGYTNKVDPSSIEDGIWWEEQEARNARANDLESVFTSETFRTERAALMSAREDLGLKHKLDWDERSHEFFCLGCYEEVDEIGWCECYDYVEASCNKIANDCTCVEKMLVATSELLLG